MIDLIWPERNSLARLPAWTNAQGHTRLVGKVTSNSFVQACITTWRPFQQRNRASEFGLIESAPISIINIDLGNS
jgi:hypothetical protein